MSAFQIGKLVANLKAPKMRRSGEPVWRNSYYEGQIEGRIWRPFAGGKVRGAKRRIGAVLKSARELERRTRRQRKGLPGAGDWAGRSCSKGSAGRAVPLWWRALLQGA